MSDDGDLPGRLALIVRAVEGAGDLDAAILELFRLPEDVPRRASLAAGLIGAVLRAGIGAGLGRLRDLDRLIALADSDPPDTPDWPAQRAVARAMALTRAAAERELADPRAALAEVESLAAKFGDESRFTPLFDSAVAALKYSAAVADGDLGALTEVLDGMRKLRQDPRIGGDPATAPTVDVLAKAAAVLSANENGGDLRQALADLAATAESLPSGHHLRATVAETTAMMSMMLGGGDQRSAPERSAAAVAAAGNPALTGADRALYQAGAAMVGLDTETDVHRVDAAVEQMRGVVRSIPPSDPQRPFFLTGLALGLYRRSELTNAVADLDDAAGLLAEARTLAGGPQHPQWSMINEMLSEMHRRRGAAPEPHKLAMEGLRAYTWRVLMQTDLARANAAVRDAARDALDIARQCLAGGDPAAAIQALDAGRGLALFAATEIRTVADRLDEAGRADLAARWRAAVETRDPAQLPSELRRAVLTALSEHSSAAALLDPPGLNEIQEALTNVDADALVYLVPGEEGLSGYAVVAPASGPPGYLALPNLRPGDEQDVEKYLIAAGDRELAASLDRLCDWAWRAAIGPLVETCLPRLAPAPSGRVRRVVLVAMGDLARIPWQAARRSGGAYAIESLAISQAASARMLCHSAALAPVPIAPTGLVVGDPDTTGADVELSNSRMEAFAVQQTFYRGARYVGRRPDGSVSPSGAGTRADVERWLASRTPGAGAMLHLACHAQTEPGESYLLLAGGERLDAEKLIGVLAAAPEHLLGLIVLAACRSGVAINGYDEAYSLGTAFLAGGARSVLSTQWAAPDRVTSPLMYMFHHNLMVERLPAWAALREAQLWMLDPERAMPDGAPPLLRSRGRSQALKQVVAWAGFVHWGQ